MYIIFLSYLFPFTFVALVTPVDHVILPFAFVEYRQSPSQGRSGGSWGKVDSMEKLEAAESLPIKIGWPRTHSMVWFFLKFIFWWWHLKVDMTFLVIHQHTVPCWFCERTKHTSNKTMWCMWFRWSVDILFLGDAKVFGPQKFWENLSFISQKTPTNTLKTCHLFHKFVEAFCGLKFHKFLMALRGVQRGVSGYPQSSLWSLVVSYGSPNVR